MFDYLAAQQLTFILYHFTGNWDIYVFNPQGRRFRSVTEIKKFLDENPGIVYDPLVLTGRPPELLSQNPRKSSIGLPKRIKPPKETIILPKEGKQISTLHYAPDIFKM